MSTIGTLELLVHLEKFRNIDMYYQGLYYIKLSSSISGGALRAVEIFHDSDSLPSLHPHKLQEPWTTSEECASPMFFLRYSEEIVELNTVCSFKGEVEVKPGYIDEPLELSVDLYFTDLEGTITLVKVYDTLLAGFDSLTFKKVASAKFKVSNPMLGVSQYTPILFDELYSSVFHSCVHCSLTNFQFALHREPALEAKDVARILFPQHPEIVPSEVAEKAYHATVMLLALTHNKIRRLLLNVFRLRGIANRRQIVPAAMKLPVTVDILTKMHFSMDSKLAKSPLTTCVATRDPQALASIFMNEVEHVSRGLRAIRALLVKVTEEHSAAMLQTLEFSYLQAMKARWEENVCIEPKTHMTRADLKRAKSQSEAAIKKRHSNSFRYVESLEVEDVSVLPPAELHPILFEETLSGHGVSGWSPDWFSSRHSPELRRNIHVFVLVHGLMGSSFDMKYVKDTISLHRPQSVILTSKSNETQTEGSIEDAGQNLAIEVATFLEGSIRDAVDKISFIGHSLGGLIIRAALPLLGNYKDKMYSLITLSSPHLGCTNSKSKLVGAGLWVITKLKKSHSLKQLGIVDTIDPRSSFIYTLSKAEGLEWFRYLILVSSEQDSYVPFESARIEAISQLQKEMAETLLGNCTNTKVVRVNVNFGKSGSTIGTLIGRTAHIRMLDNKAFLTMLIYRYAEAFL